VVGRYKDSEPLVVLRHFLYVSASRMSTAGKETLHTVHCDSFVRDGIKVDRDLAWAVS
jgi:hypothetical protein